MSRTLLEALNTALSECMAANPNVLLLGEDILDPYGGSFKVTRGLSTRYPLQVLTSPISEGALAGVAAGMALRGLRPVVEVMFGDFLTLMADQIINHISKVSWMYGETLPLPLVIRTPMGGRRGYGPTHSQTLEKHFLGTPGINVVAPVCLSDGSADPQELLKHIILDSNTPTLFIENKLQYLQPVQTAADLPDFLIETIYDKQDTTHTYPIYCLRLRGAPRATLTLTAYGYMANLAREAMLDLAYQDEIFTELIIPTRLAPFNLTGLGESLHKTQRLLTVEEGGLSLGWGAEIIALASSQIHLRSTGRVAARDLPVPASPALENQVLPQVADICAAARRLFTEESHA